jgi:hypothetical protein
VTELVLIGRTYCHLCDEMENALRPLLAEYKVGLKVLDADSDPALERYDELVPVLLLNGEEICHYFLDEARLRAALSSAGLA